MTEITWFGHSAFKISDGNVSLLVDPFLAGNPLCPVDVEDVGRVDVVLVTHDHGDHVGDAVEVCKKTGAMLAAVVGTAEKLIAAGVPRAQTFTGIGYNIGGTVEHKGARILMVPAFHTSDSGLPAGYIVSMPCGAVVYHAGDTCVFGDMALWGKLYKLDVALLPIGGVFTMDAVQAALACSLLHPRKVVPMHWGTFPALAQDAAEFRRELESAAPGCICVDMRPGQTITV